MPSRGNRRFLDIIAAVSTDGVHLHVYPSPWSWIGSFEEFFADYLSLARDNRFFHFHRPVSHAALQHDLRQYDAGFFDARFTIEGYTAWKLRYAASNKIFDYLDAGLPVIATAVPFQRFILARHGAAVDGGRLESEGRRYLESLDWGALRDNVARAREHYSVRRHAPRLAAFYESLA